MHLGLIGFGSIGRELFGRLAPDGHEVTALTRSPIAGAPAGLTRAASCAELIAARPQLVVECAGHGAVRAHAAQVLGAGIPLVIASLGALADPALEEALRAAARTPGARLIYPSGAIGGLDLLRALAPGGGLQLAYRGIKPPAAWKGSPAEERIALDGLQDATEFFRGTGREAALAFPKNANVVAALALAGARFDTMSVTLTADPAAPGNIHSYSVTSPLCSYEMSIQNAPSSGNARSSMTTVLSIEQEVRAFAAQAGTAGS